MDDLLAEFIAESRDMLEALSGEVVAWEADPADRTRLDAIFRFVHTVKGNCGFFDFPAAGGAKPRRRGRARRRTRRAPPG
jgi:two-component system chemotaxis sensor kinase CheA